MTIQDLTNDLQNNVDWDYEIDSHDIHSRTEFAESLGKRLTELGFELDEDEVADFTAFGEVENLSIFSDEFRFSLNLETLTVTEE